MSDEKAISEIYTPVYTPDDVESDMAFSLSGIHNYRIINGVIYFRIKIPHRIRRWFVSHDSSRVSSEILRSLRTKIKLIDNDPEKTPVPKYVRDQLIGLHYEATKTFFILERQGVPDEVKRSLARELFPERNVPVAKVEVPVLITFKLVEDELIAHLTNVKKWRIKSIDDVGFSLRLFREVCGDQPLDAITLKTAKEFRDKLQLLPKNMTKNPRYRDKTASEILLMDNVIPMSITSVNKHLSWLKFLFSFAIRQEYTEKNPFDNSDLSVEKDTVPEEERRIYTTEELQRIASNVKWDEKYPHRFWVILIGMFHGIRANQICQLDCADIVKVDNIPCFKFIPESQARAKDAQGNSFEPKHIKTAASKKQVPVHPSLIRLGFLKFVEHVAKKGHKKLFPELVPKRQLYSHEFTRWYGEKFNIRLICPGQSVAERATFHSFRHNVSDYLKQARVPGPLISAIVGHVNDEAIIIDTSQTMTRYGKQYHPGILIDILTKLDFETSLDFRNVVSEAQRCMEAIGVTFNYRAPSVFWSSGQRRIDTTDFPESAFASENQSDKAGAETETN